MKALQVALWMETMKVRRTKIFSISIYFFIFIGVMMGALMFLSMHPEIASRSATMSMKTSFLEGADWNSFFNLLLQMVLTVGVIGSGIITAWGFGREYSDRVIKDLIVLPVSRSAIVLAKIIVLFIWSFLLSLALLVSGMIMGLLLDLQGWEVSSQAHFLKIFMICSILNGLLITPVAFVASAGRGYMLAIAFVIFILIITQLLFVGMPGLSYWFPWAVPALFSGVAGEEIPLPGIMSYIIYFIFVIGGGAGTMALWRFSDHK
jgi:ABC-2 type transport system permease protein